VALPQRIVGVLTRVGPGDAARTGVVTAAVGGARGRVVGVAVAAAPVGVGTTESVTVGVRLG